MPVSEICNRAYDLKLILEHNRDRIDWRQLLRATSEEDLSKALASAFDRAKEILTHKSRLLLETLRDKQFPLQRREAQEQFIADSLAALGRVSIRRSRDIVQRERSSQKKLGKILRREFYVECSCGYHGPAFHNACPDCRAPVSYVDFASGFVLPAPY